MGMRIRLITPAGTGVDIPHHGTLTSRNWSQSFLKLFLLFPIFRSSILKPNLSTNREQNFSNPLHVRVHNAVVLFVYSWNLIVPIGIIEIGISRLKNSSLLFSKEENWFSVVP